jgi:hypothetical protein
MTDTPMAVEVNCETGEVTTRPLTAEEIAAQKAAAAQAEVEAKVRETEEKAIANAKASAQAKLAKLGLTEQEISALIS